MAVSLTFSVALLYVINSRLERFSKPVASEPGGGKARGTPSDLFVLTIEGRSSNFLLVLVICFVGPGGTQAGR